MPPPSYLRLQRLSLNTPQRLYSRARTITAPYSVNFYICNTSVCQVNNFGEFDRSKPANIEIMRTRVLPRWANPAGVYK